MQDRKNISADKIKRQVYFIKQSYKSANISIDASFSAS